MFVKTLLAKHGWNVIRIHMKTLQPQVENEILKQFTLQLICDKKCLVSQLSLILITIKPLIYNVPGLKCRLIIPPTLVLVDHFSYLTRNILTYTVQIHAIVNPHTQKLSINYAYLYLYVGTYADLGVEIQKHAL